MFVWQRLVQTPVKTLFFRQLCTPCMVLLKTSAPAAALVADDLVALDADERRHVAELPQASGLVVGDELAVGEDLEVAVGMRGEHVEQVRVHERLAADDAEEDVAHLLGFADQLVQRLRLNDLLLGGHIDPAALAAQVAAIDDRDVQKRRKDLAAPQPPLVPLDRQHALEAHVPGQLPEEPLVGLQQQTLRHLQ